MDKQIVLREKTGKFCSNQYIYTFSLEIPTRARVIMISDGYHLAAVVFEQRNQFFGF